MTTIDPTDLAVRAATTLIEQATSNDDMTHCFMAQTPGGVFGAVLPPADVSPMLVVQALAQHPGISAVAHAMRVRTGAVFDGAVATLSYAPPTQPGVPALDVVISNATNFQMPGHAAMRLIEVDGVPTAQAMAITNPIPLPPPAALRRPLRAADHDNPDGVEQALGIAAAIIEAPDIAQAAGHAPAPHALH